MGKFSHSHGATTQQSEHLNSESNTIWTPKPWTSATLGHAALGLGRTAGVATTERARLLDRAQAPAYVRRDFILTGYLVGEQRKLLLRLNSMQVFFSLV